MSRPEDTGAPTPAGGDAAAMREAAAKEADAEVASAKALGSGDGARFAGYVAKHIRALPLPAPAPLPPDLAAIEDDRRIAAQYTGGPNTSAYRLAAVHVPALLSALSERDREIERLREAAELDALARQRLADRIDGLREQMAEAQKALAPLAHLGSVARALAALT